jgi:hypothetical protein
MDAAAALMNQNRRGLLSLLIERELGIPERNAR